MDPAIVELFPFLSTIPEREVLLQQASRKQLEHKEVLVRDGADCSFLPFVLEGALRVYKTSESGRELTLYRIERGETCILSASCLQNGGNFPAIAEADGPVDVLMIPAKPLLRLVGGSAAWQGFLLDQYSRRLEMTLTLVEEVAFHHMDARLAAHLLKQAGPADSVRATHAELASDLGTSREVVTRILKDFEAAGIITTHRGEVRILARAELGARAALPVGM
ncbi:MAG TPA: Crp/Fnr family transcriptional regulator [Spirochaetia bacterium]